MIFKKFSSGLLLYINNDVIATIRKNSNSYLIETNNKKPFLADLNAWEELLHTESVMVRLYHFTQLELDLIGQLK